MATLWGDRCLNELRASDIEGMKNAAAASARSRRSHRHGRHAGEHVVAAARAIYNRAIADGLIDHKHSPAHRVAKPRRLPNTRRALTAWELEEINTTARVSGNDTVLDALLLRLHTDTACRRGGALGIRLEDLLIKLREKGSTVRWQPITPALTTCLVEHAAARGAVLPTDPILRYRDGRPLISRRYDHLWKRLGDRLPWVAAQGISTPLAPPHRPYLGRTTLRLRHRRGLRQPHRQHRTSHHDLHQSQPARSHHRARRHDQPATSPRPTTTDIDIPGDFRSAIRDDHRTRCVTRPNDKPPTPPHGVAHLTQLNSRRLPSEP